MNKKLFLLCIIITVLICSFSFAWEYDYDFTTIDDWILGSGISTGTISGGLLTVLASRSDYVSPAYIEIDGLYGTDDFGYSMDIQITNDVNGFFLIGCGSDPDLYSEVYYYHEFVGMIISVTSTPTVLGFASSNGADYTGSVGNYSEYDLNTWYNIDYRHYGNGTVMYRVDDANWLINHELETTSSEIKYCGFLSVRTGSTSSITGQIDNFEIYSLTLNEPPEFDTFEISNSLPIFADELVDLKFNVSDVDANTLNISITWFKSTDNETWSSHSSDDESWTNQANSTYNGYEYHTSSMGDLESSDIVAGEYWKAQGTISSGDNTYSINSTEVYINESLVLNVTRSINQGVISSGVSQADVYFDKQVYLVDENNNQVHVVADSVVVYNDQAWIFNYDNSTTYGLFNLTPSVYVLEMGYGDNSTNADITSRVQSLIDETLN